MADGPDEPGRRSRRYESVTGGKNQRIIYYLARRKLGYSPAEWDALPWHHQQLFIEGFEMEADDGEEGGSGHNYGPETDGMEHEDAFDKALSGAKRRHAERAS